MLPRSFLPFWMEADGAAVPPVRGQGRVLGFFLAVCGGAALYASLYAPSASGNWGWYPRLLKPSWAPPPAITGPVSTLFYGVLAVAIWRIWRTGAFRAVPFTLVGFICLLFLQSIWSTLFYGLQSPLLGLVDLLIVWLLSAVLWLTYMPNDAVAARLWLAYLIWAGLLLPVNAAIWWLNA